MAVNPTDVAPLNQYMPITEDGHRPDPMFLQAINNAFQQLRAQVAQIQAVQQQATQAQQQAAVAQQTANTPPSSVTKGSATQTITVTTAWTPGPQVDLVGVVPDSLTLSATIQFGPGGFINGGLVSGEGYSTLVTAMAEMRIVEIVGAVETQVYPVTGQALISCIGGFQITSFYYVLSPQFTADLAAFTAARVSAGAVSYRMDMRVTAPITTPATTLEIVNAYLFAQRA